MSWHDDRCEWFTSRTQTCPTCEARAGQNTHCHCGSRAFVLCEGCRSGQHLKHTTMADLFGTEHPCQCDLEDVA